MSVNVSYKGTVHSYGVSHAMLVENLKKKISERQYLYQFKLMLGQTELLDQTPVIKYLFTSFTLCYADKETAVEINDITLGVAVFVPEDQKVFTEKATPEMTVGQLKQMISRKLISTGSKWTLKKDGQEITDGNLLKTHLVLKTFTVINHDLQLTIKFKNQLYSINARSDLTILELKRQVSNRTRIQVKNIGLAFNGQYLDQYEEVKSKIEKNEMKRDYESQTLKSLGIMDGSVILVLIKLNKRWYSAEEVKLK